jgi:type IV pilus assembly protein PilC
MLFKYKALDKQGSATEGTIDAVSADVAIGVLQRRGLVISSLDYAEKKPFWEKALFQRVSNRDVVFLSRQISTLFEAQVSALRVFRLLSAESESTVLRDALGQIGDDIQGGDTISGAMSKHPAIFSEFYVSMVRSGEESGTLDKSFSFLADYLDRTYATTSKARNALIYPAFVVLTFIVVMALMFTIVIPRISEILDEVGSEIPLITKVIIGMSSFLVDYGAFFVLVIVALGVFAWRYSLTKKGALAFSQMKIRAPYVGDLYMKIYLSRVADNMSTMLVSGIPMTRALEVTATVVGDELYTDRLEEVLSDVKGGSSLSDALGKHSEFPGIIVQMIRVGEETGELSNILEMVARFYRREVNNTVDTLVNLIEPIMIVALGLAVGFLLTAVLLPIYSISSAL